MLSTIDWHLKDRGWAFNRVVYWLAKEGLLKQKFDPRFDEDSAFVYPTHVGVWIPYFQLQLNKLLNSCCLLQSYSNYFTTELVFNKLYEGRRFVAIDLGQLVDKFVRDIDLVKGSLYLNGLVSQHVLNDMVRLRIVLSWDFQDLQLTTAFSWRLGLFLAQLI